MTVPIDGSRAAKLHLKPPRTPSSRAVACCVAGVVVLAGASIAAQPSRIALIASIPVPAEIIAAEGDYLYLASGDRLSVVDVANPATPRLSGAITLPGRIYRLVPAGALVYVAGDVFGLGIVDVANPASPALRGSLQIRGGQALGVAVSGTTAVVANMLSGAEIVDVSDPAKPRSLAAHFTDGYAHDVAVSGALAYVVDQPSGLSVLDLSDPKAPVAVGRAPSPEKWALIAVGVAGPRLTIACVLSGRNTFKPRGSGLDIYDVTIPSAPVRRASFRTPGGALGIALAGSRAYVADGSAGLQVLDLSDPGIPAIAGSYATASAAIDVAARGSLVYLALGSAGAVILRAET
jgi:hypothetical protein